MRRSTFLRRDGLDGAGGLGASLLRAGSEDAALSPLLRPPLTRPPRHHPLGTRTPSTTWWWSAAGMLVARHVTERLRSS